MIASSCVGIVGIEEVEKLVDPMLMTNPHDMAPVVDAFKKEKHVI